ncbi:protein DMP6 [Dioscorea cayenensis subsp. rotundata]|uniref:Protein DMP6 n=1 Tax=Dioscorea cayennensis subsp. rotundata TaxID=55577 RepID=A0AB40B6P7_DIOCR|nr:protein DMP6 [Dioscorea cayenensis subsp. rotundata]
MKISEEDEEEHDQEKQPLLSETQETLIQKAINQTFKSTAHLANLLPTGTVLTFHLLSPIFTSQGHCTNSINQSLTILLLSLCTFSCFFLSFTDSFKDSSGKVRYGFATLHGLWILDGGSRLSPEMEKSYRMKFIDWLHAFMNVLVFGAVALFNKNVVMCFFPEPSEDIVQLLTCLPVGIGVVCSSFFVAFPTTRHGIGFPLSP